jgi:tripartite-type tricarboxylate transporter receptor subunit TctC
MAAMLTCSAHAQDYPSQPIRILVGFGAGGATDAIARLYAKHMSEILKTPVIVDNKPGANQMVAINTLRNSPPNGYTLYVATGSSLAQNPALHNDLGYDPLHDFTLIGMEATISGVLFVDPRLPVHSLDELVAYAAAHPNTLNYGSAGQGTAGHLANEALSSATGMKATHVPYKSDADVIRSVMSGTVQVGIETTLSSLPAVKAGKIRAIAVTSAARLPYLRDVPSVAESGYKSLANLGPHSFYALVGPAGLPPSIVTRLNETLNRISRMPEVVRTMRESYYADPAESTPATFQAFVESELSKWKLISKTVKLD